jgi:hypothetical protein
MKRNSVILLVVLLGATRLLAAESPASSPSTGTTKAFGVEQKAELPKFDLNFPGGTPGELVAAISKASGHPLNAIIPREDEAVVLPPLRMRHVDVSQIFDALGVSSKRLVPNLVGTSSGGNKSWTYVDIGYGFKHQGAVDQDTIWSFHRNQPAPIPPEPSLKVCWFHQINPYLKNYSIESITTAIETGWKMLNIAEPPVIRFHKDTGLLIAVGEPDQLKVIDQVLRNLETPKAPPPPAPVQTTPKPDVQ